MIRWDGLGIKGDFGLEMAPLKGSSCTEILGEGWPVASGTLGQCCANLLNTYYVPMLC